MPHVIRVIFASIERTDEGLKRYIAETLLPLAIFSQVGGIRSGEIELGGSQDGTILIVNERLDGGFGLELVRRAHRAHPDMPIFAIVGGRAHIGEAVRAGARSAVLDPQKLQEHLPELIVDAGLSLTAS